ncbi:unnamed protein product [Protopolystoma xenopodis]|uniref:Uncharacterized protein n=1 Tax=Protopolystoma xenopodis TaxID=117903 RepID=A0A3S5FEF6_9PLAT|nr:unnamed protein product [Protopolystoma xenopodis]
MAATSNWLPSERTAIEITTLLLAILSKSVRRRGEFVKATGPVAHPNGLNKWVGEQNVTSLEIDDIAVRQFYFPVIQAIVYVV